jgi:hypothetical protein
LLGFTLTYFHEFWWSCDLQGLNRKTSELARHMTPKTCPNQLLQKSNLEVLQRNNQSTTLWRARRDDRNGYIICHIRCRESEDIRRREGFGKTGITPSFGLRLMQINTFGNGMTTRTHSWKMSPNGAHLGPTGPIMGPTGPPPPSPPRSIFWNLPPPPPRINLNHLFRLVWSYGTRYLLWTI